MKSLEVRYNEQVVGTLFQDDSGKMSFQYSSDWLTSGFAISISLPLRTEPFTEPKCRPFFEGLLPEDAIREEIARNLGISSRNDFALLKEIGGDCAGAISVGNPKETFSEKYEEEIDDKRLSEALKPLIGRPLFAGEKDIRLSIAGTQRKLPIIYKGGKFYIPHGDIPTTAIIKPEIQGIDGSTENEFFCLSLARKIGLPVPDFEMLDLGLKYLIIKRYDRIEMDGGTIRLHQEDLCQATGTSSENKYQKDGGPGFKDLFSIIRAHSFQPAFDIRNAIRVIIFNYIIGNADAHGKNFSFLIKQNAICLAPFYDLLSTQVYPNLSQKMAMKIGNKYDPNFVFKRHWNAFADDISVNFKLVEKELEYIANGIKKHVALITSKQPVIINKILQVIWDNLKRLEENI